MANTQLRRQVRDAIKTVLLRTPGVTNVHSFLPKVSQQTWPLVVVYLTKARETSASATRPQGKRHIKYTAVVQLLYFDVTPDGSGEQDFDDMLDAMDQQIRDDPTLGGLVLASAVEYIETSMMPGQMNGQEKVLMAVKQFDVTVQTTG